MILKVLFLHFGEVIERLSLGLGLYAEDHLTELFSFKLIQVVGSSIVCHKRISSSWALSLSVLIGRRTLTVIQNICDHISPKLTLRLNVSNRLLWVTLRDVILHLAIIVLLLLLHVKVGVIILSKLLACRIHSLRKLSSITLSVILDEPRILLTNWHRSLALATCCLSVLNLFGLRPITLV